MRVPAHSLTPPTPARSNNKMWRRVLGSVHLAVLVAGALAVLPGFAQAQKKADKAQGIVVADAATNDWTETGTASWYGPGFAGRHTASGETYDPRNLTAAHRTLPLGSLVRVHNLDNDRNMVVRINDRGPFVKGRVIDVSQAAAEVLGFRNDGVTKVRITPLAPPPNAPAPRAKTVKAPAAAAETPAAAAEPPAGTAPAASQATEEDDAPPFVTESTQREHPGENTPCTIQLGAFRDNRHAQELLQSSGVLGLALHVEYSDGMYRVVAGPFESSEGASAAAEEIQRQGLNAFVRRGR